MYYISNITLKDIRAFEDLKLTFQFNESRTPNRTVIIGENGTGKTTLLRTIALSLMDHADANAAISEENGDFISLAEDTAKITICLFNPDKNVNRVSINSVLKRREGKEIVANKDEVPTDLFLCGYGAGRGAEGTSYVREYRILDSAYTLFEYSATYVGIELTLRRLKDFLGTKVYDSIMAGIIKVLGLTKLDNIETPKGGGVTISGPSVGGSIPLGAWADGYRTTLGWVLDFYAWAMRADAVQENGRIKGIVLIDELEQHLHPSMHSNILPNLSKLLPHVQFVVTTHSPSIALSADPSEVIVLKRHENVVRQVKVPDFSGFSADEMLENSNIFATNIHSREIQIMLSEYRELKKTPTNKMTSDQRSQLQKLGRSLRQKSIDTTEDETLKRVLEELRQKFSL